MNKPKLKLLNKETITFVLREVLNISNKELFVMVEVIWNSDDQLEALQKPNKAMHLTSDKATGK